MSRGIRKIRKSIAQRNRLRNIQAKQKKSAKKQLIPSFPQEEEKHGYTPTYIEQITPEKKSAKRKPSGLLIKGALSVALFISTHLLLSTSNDVLDKPKQWTSYLMEENFPFARVTHWYQTTFGTPLAFMPTSSSDISSNAMAMPVSGNVIETFQSNGQGIKIAADESSPVNAWHDGVVIFAGNDREMNKTVIIQHADNSKSTYGMLSSIDVHLYQYVKGNEQLGTFHPNEAHETIYFSIEKNNEFIDPVQVLEVNDHP